jgi:hypothetical protein
MTSEDIECVIREFGPTKWIGFETNNAAEGVFLIKATPLPPLNELERVIADICTGGIPVHLNGGKVYHSDECQARRHVIQNATVKRSLRRLKEETFNVAIHPNIAVGPLKEAPLLGGQPIAIAFEPAITYMSYPDHPHLNMGTPLRRFPGTQYLLPDSICYTSNPNKLGDTQRERLLATFDEVTIWLLRYQIWVATRELRGHGIWIGPHEGQIEPDYFPLRLNPQGPCRCGNRKTYTSCHMTDDLAMVKQKHGDNVAAVQKQNIDSGWWVKAVFMPQKNIFEFLKQEL